MELTLGLYESIPDVQTIEKLGGLDNDNYLVSTTNREPFVVKCYRTRSSAEVLSEIDLLLHIQNSVSCIRPINIPGRSLIFEICGLPAVAFQFVSGHVLIDRDLTSELLFDVGREIGRLHKVTRGLKYRIYWNLDDTIAQAISLSKSLVTFYPVVSDFIQREAEFAATLKSSVDYFVCLHGDISLSNVLMSNGRMILCDFDDSTIGSVEIDLAAAIRNLLLRRLDSTTSAQDPIRSLVNGYEQEVQLKLGSLGSWLRFVCFRYYVLMLVKSLHEPEYPSQNDINYGLFLKAYELEKSLNAM